MGVPFEQLVHSAAKSADLLQSVLPFLAWQQLPDGSHELNSRCFQIVRNHPWKLSRKCESLNSVCLTGAAWDRKRGKGEGGCANRCGQKLILVRTLPEMTRKPRTGTYKCVVMVP